MNRKEAFELIKRYNEGRVTEEERNLLDHWYHQEQSRQNLNEEETNYFLFKEKIWDGVLKLSGISKRNKVFKLTLWQKAASVAALITVMMFTGLYYVLRIHSKNNIQQNQIAGDIAPGNFGATLVLSNGKQIALSAAKNGKIANEGGISISKAGNGQLIYSIGQNRRDTNRVNTLRTVNGQFFQVVLPDQSKVWLNAASSLTYNTKAVNNGERKVILVGEGYFEIAKDRAHPFVVITRGQELKVLGTHFNVNSYQDEEKIATTLLEGSVRISAGKTIKTLSPGEQALNDGHSIRVSDVDTDEVIDWKNGDFSLNDIDFKSAMRKIARWYDMEVVYAPDVPQNLRTGGWIARSNNLSVVLKSIEASGQVHLKIEGKKIIVSK